MSIKKKILFAILPLFLLFGLVSMGLVVRALNIQGDNSLAAIRSIMSSNKDEKLRDLVDNTYEILVSQHRAANDPAMVAKEYERQLQSVINLAYSSIESIHKRSDLTDEEKQKLAFSTVEGMRYAGNNYLWINDLSPTMVMHPIKPSLNGKDLSDFKDPNGKKLFVEMAKVCAENGSGFVDYSWPKPGEEKPVPKLSYVRLFKPWNWVVGTGVYLEAAETQFQNDAKRQIGNLRFGDGGQDYFFILDTNATIVMHPIKPELNGKDMSGFTDPKGTALFAEMVKVGKSKGQGFVEYYWAKPGEDEPVQKLSYVRQFNEWGWIVGTGIYIDDIEKAMAEQEKSIAAVVSEKKWWVIGVSGIMIVLAGLVVSFITQRLTSPIVQAAAMLKDIAEGEGDLTKRLEVKTNDELKEMAKWFNIFVEKLQNMIKGMASDSSDIQGSAGDLSRISNNMSTKSSETSDKANNVAAAMEEMSTNMVNVANSMEDTAGSVDVVAAAVEEMTSTINEIAETSEKARSITENAVVQASESSERVDELGSSAQEISKVLETIADISDQVDLLALNATIEAARAGEAGKGFAVVASEIKELAKQTAEATDQIKDRIDSIQKTTMATVSQIQTISEVVGENSDIVNTIATAVEEQSVTANEIAGSVAQISQGIQEINMNVAQSSEVSQDVAREIADVNNAASEISTNSDQVSSNASRLSKLADGFAELVGSFKV